MIKFIPFQSSVKSIFKDKDGFLNNAKNKSIATQLENRFKDVSCPTHLYVESKISVMQKVDGLIMGIEAYCCENFKETLSLIAQEKFPLPPKEK